MKAVTAATLALVVVSAAAAHADHETCFCQATRFWGGQDGFTHYGVALRGGLAFVGSLEGRVTVLDVGDPVQPQEIGHWDSGAAGWTLQLAVDGDRLWVLDGGDGVFLVDVSDPTVPATLGYLALGPEDAVGLAAGDGRAAIAVSQRVWLVAPNAAGAPTLAATLAEGYFVSYDALALAGDRLLVGAGRPGDGRGRLLAFDVSDPHRPLQVADVDVLDTLANGYNLDSIAQAEASRGKVMLRLSGYVFGPAGDLVAVDPQHPDVAPQLSLGLAGIGGMAVRGDVVASTYGNPASGDPPIVTLGDVRRPNFIIIETYTGTWGDRKGMMATDGRHVWLTADGLLEMHDFSCCDLLEIFSDDLESTDATAWSDAVTQE